MDGSMNMVVELNQSRYFILYVGIHGGSGFGANEPYDGRFYLVEKEFFEKNRDTYHMVHDSLLPKAWNYYEKMDISSAPSMISPLEMLRAV